MVPLISHFVFHLLFLIQQYVKIAKQELVSSRNIVLHRTLQKSYMHHNTHVQCQIHLYFCLYSKHLLKEMSSMLLSMKSMCLGGITERLRYNSTGGHTTKILTSNFKYHITCIKWYLYIIIFNMHCPIYDSRISFMMLICTCKRWIWNIKSLVHVITNLFQLSKLFIRNPDTFVEHSLESSDKLIKHKTTTVCFNELKFEIESYF